MFYDILITWEWRSFNDVNILKPVSEPVCSWWSTSSLSNSGSRTAPRELLNCWTTLCNTARSPLSSLDSSSEIFMASKGVPSSLESCQLFESFLHKWALSVHYRVIYRIPWNQPLPSLCKAHVQIMSIEERLGRLDYRNKEAEKALKQLETCIEIIQQKSSQLITKINCFLN